MEQIITKLDQALELCNVKIKELDSKLAKVNDTIAKQKEIDGTQDAKATELSRRESEVKSIEDVAKVLKDAQELSEKTAKERAELDRTLAAFSAYQDQVAAEFGTRGKDLAEKENICKGREEAMTSREQNFETELNNAIKKILKK